MPRGRIAILASGNGTTAEAVIRASADNTAALDVALVIASKSSAGIFKRVEALNRQYGLHIPCVLIGKENHPAAAHEQPAPGAQTAAEEQAILQALQAGDFDLIVLMGYMKRIGPSIVKAFGWRPDLSGPYYARLLNTHPGLLPETQGQYGLPAQEYVLQQGFREAGQTLHVVAEAYDDGPVIAEHRVAVEADETGDSLFAKVQAVEKANLAVDLMDFWRNRRCCLEQRVGAAT